MIGVFMVVLGRQDICRMVSTNTLDVVAMVQANMLLASDELTLLTWCWPPWLLTCCQQLVNWHCFPSVSLTCCQQVHKEGEQGLNRICLNRESEVRNWGLPLSSCLFFLHSARFVWTPGGNRLHVWEGAKRRKNSNLHQKKSLCERDGKAVVFHPSPVWERGWCRWRGLRSDTYPTILHKLTETLSNLVNTLLS